MIKVLVVDDEPPARNRIKNLIRQEQDLLLVGESGDGMDALAKVKQLAPDLIFLDIKMPGLSGLQLSQLLRQDRTPQIIFTTAYGEHAVEAFAVDAVDYLLKPFDKERFRQALDKLRTRLEHGASAVPAATDSDRVPSHSAAPTPPISPRTAGRLTVKDGSRLKFLSLGDITHMQSEGDYLHIYTASGQRAMIRERMRAMEQRVGGRTFVRISRSVIINLDHVKEMKPRQRGAYEFLLRTGERFASGTTYRSAVRRLLAEITGPG